ncbi:MAG: hypothetical protein K2Y01_10060 [Rhabdochlamydiaceae bacterium]|nr:hypothetical protein [Rhabdochlamydiaceae bacterium]
MRTQRFYFSFAVLASFSLFFAHRLESEFLWPIIQPLEESGELSSLIEERIIEIRSLSESLRPLIQKEALKHQKFLARFWSIFSIGRLNLESEGAAAAYALYNPENEPLYIIKPTDECVFCLNNPKHYASPFVESRYPVKNHIPLYRSAQTDAFCYELAKTCGIMHITPQTVLSLLSHTQFFYLYPEIEKNQIPEKLCSIQEYLKNTFSLRKILQEIFTLHLSEKEIQERFDQEDFEDLTFFLWLTSDIDAHVENFRAYIKYVSAEGNPIYGLRKIDNSLSFPEINAGFSNALMYFPNALLPLSNRTRSQIHSLPLEKIQELMSTYRLESSYKAFEERIFTLQKAIEKENITYYECGLRLALLSTSEGKKLAVKNCSLKLLEHLAKDLIKIQHISHPEKLEKQDLLKLPFTSISLDGNT